MSGVARRTAGRFAWCLLGMAVAASLAVAFGAGTNQWRVIPMLSGSMAPYLETGDAAFARPMPASELAVGDIVVFHPPETDTSGPPTVHRVISMESVDGVMVVRTKGDANPIVDSWELTIADSQVWRVERSFPDVGDVVFATKRPTVWFGALVLVGLFMLISSLRPVRTSSSQPVGIDEIDANAGDGDDGAHEPIGVSSDRPGSQSESSA